MAAQDEGYTLQEKIHIDKSTFADLKEHTVVAQRVIMGDATQRSFDKNAMVYASIGGMERSAGMLGPYPVPDTPAKAETLLKKVYANLVRNMKARDDTGTKMSVRLLQKTNGKDLFTIPPSQISFLVKFFTVNIDYETFPRYFIPLLCVYYDKSTKNASFRVLPIMINSKAKEDYEKQLLEFTENMRKAKEMKEKLVNEKVQALHEMGDDITHEKVAELLSNNGRTASKEEVDKIVKMFQQGDYDLSQGPVVLKVE